MLYTQFTFVVSSLLRKTQPPAVKHKGWRMSCNENCCSWNYIYDVIENQFSKCVFRILKIIVEI